jgi:hypothetical protein
MSLKPLQSFNTFQAWKRGFVILLYIIGTILTYYITEKYLRNNFAYNGEEYWKGAGHILRENLSKGLFFIICRQLIPATFIFGLVFALTDKTARKVIFRITNVFALIILSIVFFYILYKVIEIYNEKNDQLYRIIENALTWLLKVVGFYFGYILTKLLIRDFR